MVPKLGVLGSPSSARSSEDAVGSRDAEAGAQRPTNTDAVWPSNAKEVLAGTVNRLVQASIREWASKVPKELGLPMAYEVAAIALRLAAKFNAWHADAQPMRTAVFFIMMACQDYCEHLTAVESDELTEAPKAKGPEGHCGVVVDTRSLPQRVECLYGLRDHAAACAEMRQTDYVALKALFLMSTFGAKR